MLRAMHCYLAMLLIASSLGTLTASDVVPLIFDTDMGNDIDDALALGVIHALESRGECRLLAVTVSKDNLLAARCCDLINTFYGRAHVPVGLVVDGKKPQDRKYLPKLVLATDNGKPRYPHTAVTQRDVPDATSLLRRVLSTQPDRSVVLVVVGFSTNMSRLLTSEGDQYSPLDGRALVERKVKLLSMMGGRFGSDRPDGFTEYNIRTDLDAARQVFVGWPTPIVISGYEIGLSIRYPAESILNDFNYVAHHPLKEGYEAYKEMPYDRPTWDLTSVLYAVRPQRGYFGLSAAGLLSVGPEGYALFRDGEGGPHQYLTVTPEQRIRVREALEMLASQPPNERYSVVR